ncbi:MAG: c-type cytochrome [Alphaproteobacteria bacterium]|nr:c-type cytochrome [Alphaproteobacteria bacterium]
MTPRPKSDWHRRWIVLSAAAVVAAGGIWAFSFFLSAPTGADAGNAALAELGRTIYATQCAECHGAKLEGQPNWKTPRADGTLLAPPHDASGHTWHHPDSILFRITRLGGQAAAPPGFVSGMPGFGDKLSDQEIWAVLAFIKSTWPAEIRARQESINRRVDGR